MSKKMTYGRRYRVSYEGIAQPSGGLVTTEGAYLTDQLVSHAATVESLPDPEPSYEHGKWYLDASGYPWEFRATDTAYPTVRGYWRGTRGDVKFDAPLRFPDGSMHRIADGGRP